MAKTCFLPIAFLLLAATSVVAQAPAPLPKDASPRGVNRGPMLTEPSEEQLKQWLQQNGLLNVRG